MNFPLTFRFKRLALASQIFVRDGSEGLILYVRQRMFKLREDVLLFGDVEQTQPLYRIRADRVIDFAAEYIITAERSGASLGSIKRHGMRSFWKAHYEVRSAGGSVFAIHEKSAMVRMLDGVFGEIPIIGIFAGYLFHPEYLVTRQGSGEEVLRVLKRPALFEGVFAVEAAGALTDAEQELLVLGALMMVLLERDRG